MPKIKSCLVNASITLASIIVAALLIELVLRVLAPPSLFHPDLPLRPHLDMELHPELRGVSSPARHTTNKWGMRGDPVPADWDETYTILTVGGSTTQCFYIDDAKTWPYLFQKRLEDRYGRVWVGNAGIDGHSSRGHVLLMNEVVKKVKPDAIVVLVGINDLGRMLSENTGRESMEDRTGIKYRLFAKSRTLQLIYLWSKVLFGKATVVQKTGHGGFKPVPFQGQDPDFADIEAKQTHLDQYRKNLTRIVDIARMLDIRVVFITQPMRFDDTEEWAQVRGTDYWLEKAQKIELSAAALWRLMELFNKTLLQVCEEQSAECIDAASLMPKDDQYFYDSAHMTDAGNELLASIAAEHFTAGE